MCIRDSPQVIQVGGQQYIFILQGGIGAFQFSHDIGRVDAGVFARDGSRQALLQIETRQRLLRIGESQQFLSLIHIF